MLVKFGKCMWLLIWWIWWLVHCEHKRTHWRDRPAGHFGQGQGRHIATEQGLYLLLSYFAIERLLMLGGICCRDKLHKINALLSNGTQGTWPQRRCLIPQPSPTLHPHFSIFTLRKLMLPWNGFCFVSLTLLSCCCYFFGKGLPFFPLVVATISVEEWGKREKHGSGVSARSELHNTNNWQYGSCPAPVLFIC